MGVRHWARVAIAALGLCASAGTAMADGWWQHDWSYRRQITIGTAPTDFRSHSPRFEQGNIDANLALVEALRRVAEAKGVTVAQIAIAWVAAQGQDIVPLIGARRRDRLTEALGALDVQLDAADLDAIERAVPKGAAQGDRYNSWGMATLDSER